MNLHRHLNTLPWKGLALVAVMAVLVTTTAAAAGGTAVRLAADEPFTASQTTTVDVVVADADGGVGAFNFTATVANPDTAEIVDVELHGDPPGDTSQVNIADDGSAVTAIAAMVDTDDSGPVTIATIEIRGVEPGSTDLGLTVTALGDEQGHSYTTNARGTQLTVQERDDSGDGGDDESQSSEESDPDQSSNADNGDGGSTDGTAGDAADADSTMDETTETDERTVDSDTTETDRREAASTATTTATEGSASTPPATMLRTDDPNAGTAIAVPGFGIPTVIVTLIVVVLVLRRDL